MYKNFWHGVTKMTRRSRYQLSKCRLGLGGQHHSNVQEMDTFQKAALSPE